MILPKDVLRKIKDHNGWLSEMTEDSLSFDFPTCAGARIAEKEIGDIPDFTIFSSTCVIFFCKVKYDTVKSS